MKKKIKQLQQKVILILEAFIYPSFLAMLLLAYKKQAQSKKEGLLCGEKIYSLRGYRYLSRLP